MAYDTEYAVRRIDRDELVTLAHFQLAADSQIGPRSALLANAGLVYGFDKRQGAAIQDGKLKVVEFDDGVVDPATDQRGKKVFGSGNEYALFHQTGGVAHSRHVPAHGFQLKAIEVGTAKDHARSRRRRQDTQMYWSPAVKPYATAFHWRSDCLFLYQTRSAVYLFDEEFTPSGAVTTVAN